MNEEPFLRGMKIVMAADVEMKQVFCIPCVASASVFIAAHKVLCLCQYFILYKG